MTDEEKQDRVDAAMRDGYAALSEHRTDDAFAAAKVLRELRYSGAFEIEARAHWDNDEHEKAFEVLEEGVKTVPGAAPLWRWLGSFRSDAGEYDRALEAFAREAGIADSSTSANTYNVAVVYERMGRARDALDLIDRVESPADPPKSHFDELRARLLFQLGDIDGCIETASGVIAQLESSIEHANEDRDGDVESESENEDEDDDGDDSDEDDPLARAYAIRADAKLASGDTDGALRDAIEATHIQPAGAERAFDVLRRIDNVHHEAPHTWQVLIEAKRPVVAEDDDAMEALEGDPLGFAVWMVIIAGDREQALSFAMRTVPPPFDADVTISEFEDLGPEDANELCGIVESSWRMAYMSDDDDDE